MARAFKKREVAFAPEGNVGKHEWLLVPFLRLNAFIIATTEITFRCQLLLKNWANAQGKMKERRALPDKSGTPYTAREDSKSFTFVPSPTESNLLLSCSRDVPYPSSD